MKALTAYEQLHHILRNNPRDRAVRVDRCILESVASEMAWAAKRVARLEADIRRLHREHVNREAALREKIGGPLEPLLEPSSAEEGLEGTNG